MPQKRIRSLSVCILILTFVLIPSTVFETEAYASELYSNGYFRYIVEDYSVTIISYTGEENEVNVPNMIAGNPVNVIAKDAFAKNKSVKKINLPDTIMSIEEGAFAEGQSVAYDFENNEEEKVSNEGTGKTGIQEDDKKEGDYGSEVKNEITKDQGIGPTKKESRVTVDADDNLVLVDTDGVETVLDDSKNYRVKIDKDGNDVIEDSSGNLVNVTDDGYVEYIDKDNNKVSVNIKTGNKTIESSDGSYSHEEVDIGDDAVEDVPESLSRVKTQDREISKEEDVVRKNDEPEDGKTVGEETSVSPNIPVEKMPTETEEIPFVTVIIVTIAVGLAAYIVLFRRKKE